ncbi:UrcA family protein [Aurantiacibacter gangjinensis]|uniref:Uncharacterized protein n=1 Tax=Aurantiacibacter gangjinensis TaxID=502682 RepID=A0A0G9MQ70_9SPHN|nr:UrcA family protein [Aurantiacibacter gangjinensis]APE28720.1 hypothetical protein BMF35_a1891 [Aurantiacibacter gangjinensis]KLE32881.1 hypothetical protein AAW01_02350 [Aurantiacibacter gangjinensis]
MRNTLISLAAATAIFAAPAAAQDTETVTLTIQTEDLNMADADDQARFQQRVDRAIRQACATGGRDLTSRRIEAACRADLAESVAHSVEVAVNEGRLPIVAAIESAPAA